MSGSLRRMRRGSRNNTIPGCEKSITRCESGQVWPTLTAVGGTALCPSRVCHDDGSAFAAKEEDVVWICDIALISIQLALLPIAW